MEKRTRRRTNPLQRVRTPLRQIDPQKHHETIAGFERLIPPTKIDRRGLSSTADVRKLKLGPSFSRKNHPTFTFHQLSVYTYHSFIIPGMGGKSLLFGTNGVLPDEALHLRTQAKREKLVPERQKITFSLLGCIKLCSTASSIRRS